MYMKIIAIIEDDQHIGDILKRALAREGYGTLRAYSGTEALYLLSEHTPDLTLLDLMLPGLPGEAERCNFQLNVVKAFVNRI